MHVAYWQKPPIHSLVSFQNGLCCTLLPHPTSQALLAVQPHANEKERKENSSVGRSLSLHRLAPRRLHPTHSSGQLHVLFLTSCLWHDISAYIYLYLGAACHPLKLYLHATRRCAFLPILSYVLYFGLLAVCSIWKSKNKVKKSAPSRKKESERNSQGFPL